MIDGAVSHVVDDNGQIGEFFELCRYGGHASDGGQDRHGNFEIGATLPERRHEGAVEPVAGGIGRGTDSDTSEPFSGMLREVVGRGGIERVDATDSLERTRVALQDGGEEAVVVLVVDDLNDDCFRHAVGLHQVEQSFLGAASRAGTLAPCAEGKLGIVFPDGCGRAGR